MTLLLDNRKDEMSPLVHTRMLYVRDHTRQDIEQILYFSRLGATHKDYFFEPLSILEICREAVEDNLTLLEEAGFSVEYTENDAQAYRCLTYLLFSTRGLLEIRAVTLVVLRVWGYTLFRKWQLTCLSRWS